MWSGGDDSSLSRHACQCRYQSIVDEYGEGDHERDSAKGRLKMGTIFRHLNNRQANLLPSTTVCVVWRRLPSTWQRLADNAYGWLVAPERK